MRRLEEQLRERDEELLALPDPTSPATTHRLPAPPALPRAVAPPAVPPPAAVPQSSSAWDLELSDEVLAAALYEAERKAYGAGANGVPAAAAATASSAKIQTIAIFRGLPIYLTYMNEFCCNLFARCGFD